MASTRDRTTSRAGIVAVGAAAGAAVAYYLASHPGARRILWQALKATLTTTLPAILVHDVLGQQEETPAVASTPPVARG